MTHNFAQNSFLIYTGFSASNGGHFPAYSTTFLPFFERKFDAYLRQICLFDAYLRRSGGFMCQMTLRAAFDCTCHLTHKSGSCLPLQRHLSASTKFAYVESRLCSHKRPGKAVFYTSINLCVRKHVCRSVVVGLLLVKGGGLEVLQRFPAHRWEGETTLLLRENSSILLAPVAILMASPKVAKSPRIASKWRRPSTKMAGKKRAPLPPADTTHYASEGFSLFSCSNNTLQHLATAILAEKRR